MVRPVQRAMDDRTNKGNAVCLGDHSLSPPLFQGRRDHQLSQFEGEKTLRKYAPKWNKILESINKSLNYVQLSF